MAEVYFLGDLHGGHRNICNFRKGPFANEQEHWEYMRESYHSVVTKRDTVYFMGDVAFSLERMRELNEWDGIKHIILGNHDFITPELFGIFKSVNGLVKYKEFWLSHAPIHTCELRGRVNIHGHVHYQSVPDDRYFNVSLENIGFRPISLQEIRMQIQERTLGVGGEH